MKLLIVVFALLGAVWARSGFDESNVTQRNLENSDAYLAIWPSLASDEAGYQGNLPRLGAQSSVEYAGGTEYEDAQPRVPIPLIGNNGPNHVDNRWSPIFPREEKPSEVVICQFPIKPITEKSDSEHVPKHEIVEMIPVDRSQLDFNSFWERFAKAREDMLARTNSVANMAMPSRVINFHDIDFTV